jgi:hypothetical protein
LGKMKSSLDKHVGARTDVLQTVFRWVCEFMEYTMKFLEVGDPSYTQRPFGAHL